MMMGRASVDPDVPGLPAGGYGLRRTFIGENHWLPIGVSHWKKVRTVNDAVSRGVRLPNGVIEPRLLYL